MNIELSQPDPAPVRTANRGRADESAAVEGASFGAALRSVEAERSGDSEGDSKEGPQASVEDPSELLSGADAQTELEAELETRGEIEALSSLSGLELLMGVSVATGAMTGLIAGAATGVTAEVVDGQLDESADPLEPTGLATLELLALGVDRAQRVADVLAVAAVFPITDLEPSTPQVGAAEPQVATSTELDANRAADSQPELSSAKPEIMTSDVKSQPTASQDGAQATQIRYATPVADGDGGDTGDASGSADQAAMGGLEPELGGEGGSFERGQPGAGTFASVGAASPESGLAASLSAAPSFVSALGDAVAPAQTAPPPSPGPAEKALDVWAQSTQVLRQLSDGLRLDADAGSRVVNIRLDPTELGQVEVKIAIEGELARVVFITERPEVNAMLQQHMDTLRADMLAQGLQLESVEVQHGDVGARDGSDSSGSGDRQQGEGEGVLDAIEPEAPRPRRANALIDVRI